MKCQHIGTRPDPALNGLGTSNTLHRGECWCRNLEVPARCAPTGRDHAGLHALHFLRLRTRDTGCTARCHRCRHLTSLWGGVYLISPMAPMGPSTTKNQPRAGSTSSARSALTLSGSNRPGLDLPLTPGSPALGRPVCCRVLGRTPGPPHASSTLPRRDSAPACRLQPACLLLKCVFDKAGRNNLKICRKWYFSK